MIILGSKLCFQKFSERFLKRHRWRLFLQLGASFQVGKKLSFSEEKKYALRQASFWQLTNDKRGASRFHNNKNNKKKGEGSR